MRTAFFHGGADIRIEEIPTPEPGPGEVLVRIAAAGICGSDLHLYRGENPWGGWGGSGPRRGGHELAGVVSAIGAQVTGLSVGQRVGIEPMHLVGCGRCRYCQRGDYHICPTRGRRHGQPTHSAGFSEYDIVVADNLYPLPDHLSFEVAAMLDVYACGIHALNRVPLLPFNTVVIVGTGPIGMTAGQVARAAGARQVIIVGRRDAILEFGRSVGAADRVINATRQDVGTAVRALTDGVGAEVVLETVGSHEATMRLAVEAAAPGGIIGVIGAFIGDVSVPYAAANAKELDIRLCNSYSTWRGVREFQITLDMLAEGRLQAEPLVTHRFSLDRIGEGFKAANDKQASGALKVVVLP
jgi:threonine dehydrogenase-like Zn-dependent dehydrogenase